VELEADESGRAMACRCRAIAEYKAKSGTRDLGASRDRPGPGTGKDRYETQKHPGSRRELCVLSAENGHWTSITSCRVSTAERTRRRTCRLSAGCATRTQARETRRTFELSGIATPTTQLTRLLTTHAHVERQ
jgi:hypothetical protein